MYYAVFLFQQAGIGSTSSSLLANGIEGVVLNVFVWPNMYWMDKWGRRRPMIIGAVAMGISMMLIGIIMKTFGECSKRTKMRPFNLTLLKETLCLIRSPKRRTLLSPTKVHHMLLLRFCTSM
jgi:MFS family permease